MLARLIPVLLLDRSRRLVKTVRFGERTYVGDPFNVIRIFNEKEVDEVCVLDIDASIEGRRPDLGFVRELASECFMPLAYGGGIDSSRMCEELVAAGVEKIVIGSNAPETGFIGGLARDFGSQAIVVSVDVCRSDRGMEVRTRRGARAVGQDPLSYAQRMVDAGAGEILLNDIDRDGTRRGYDLDLISYMSRGLDVPLIALGGAGDRRHLRQGIKAGASAVASGSVFVFYGPLRAVLINYPSPEEVAKEILGEGGE